jgi:hypothetical protein
VKVWSFCRLFLSGKWAVCAVWVLESAGVRCGLAARSLVQ